MFIHGLHFIKDRYLVYTFVKVLNILQLNATPPTIQIQQLKGYIYIFSFSGIVWVFIVVSILTHLSREGGLRNHLPSTYTAALTLLPRTRLHVGSVDQHMLVQTGKPPTFENDLNSDTHVTHWAWTMLHVWMRGETSLRNTEIHFACKDAEHHGPSSVEEIVTKYTIVWRVKIHYKQHLCEPLWYFRGVSGCGETVKTCS